MLKPWSLVVLTAAALVSGRAWAYDRIVAFGDSLTDNGAGAAYFMEIFNMTEVYPPFPYFHGVYSNGPPYINYTAALLKLPLADYAIGGATTGAVPATDAQYEITIPSLVDQVMNYAEGSADGVSPEALHILYAGANDYFIAVANQDPQIGPDLVEAVIGNISTAVSILLEGGATSFVLPNLAPLQSTPGVSQAALGPQSELAQDVLAQLTAGHNAGLILLAADLAAQGHKVAMFDVNDFFQGLVLDGAAAFNITDTTHACYNSTTQTLCSDAENYLFFDEAHPTAQIHQLVGELLAQEIAV